MTETPGDLSGDREPAVASGRRPADTFGVRLLLARHLNGLSIKEAAEKSGLHYATWSTWEAGRRPRDLIEVCQQISEALDIEFDWLMFGGPLLPPRGRPTGRPNQVTRRYPNLTHQSRISDSRLMEKGPKGRTDPRGPSNTPRRAALVK